MLQKDTEDQDSWVSSEALTQNTIGIFLLCLAIAIHKAQSLFTSSCDNVYNVL